MNDILVINYKILRHGGRITQAHTNGDVGWDLYAADIDYTDKYIEYRTGVAIEFPEGYFGLLVPRSSLTKMDLFLNNSLGIIDESYRGELIFRYKIHPFSIDVNDDRELNVLRKHPYEILGLGDRCGQLIIMPYPKISFLEVNELKETVRGEKGFGSSGR